MVDAVERYEVHHPVLDDPELATWKQYAVRAWPTLVVVDPEGYVVAQHAGEGHAHAIEKLVEELETEHAAKGTLRRGDGPYVAPEPVATHLRFPGKALVLPDGGFLVSDSTRHRLVELEADGETVRGHFGTGERGFADGGREEARFSEPQGLAVLPDGRIAVADTVNHAIRALDLTTGVTTTLAGTGRATEALAAAEEGIALSARVGITAIAAKAAALTEYALQLCDSLGLCTSTPRDPAQRGSHVAIVHERARDLVPALAARKVVTDFREPDVVRIGCSPLTTRFTDVHDGITLVAQLAGELMAAPRAS